MFLKILISQMEEKKFRQLHLTRDLDSSLEICASILNKELSQSSPVEYSKNSNAGFETAMNKNF